MTLKSAFSITCYIPLLEQFKKLTSYAGIPQDWVKYKNCYITIAILGSHFNSGLFPVNNDPYNCNAGIYIGKLNGVMTATFPNGHLYPEEVCPSWSPATLNDL